MQDGNVFADAGSLALPATVAASEVVAQAKADGADRVHGAFVALAVGRLERDHVALLAALCDLEQNARSASVGSAAVMHQALGAVLREELRQTQHALELAAAGMLGYCERCQAPLAIGELLAQPSRTHCADCTAAIERGNQVH